MYRKGKKRLTVDIPELIFNRFKELADKHNITMTKLTLKMMAEFIIKMEQYE